MAPRKAVKATGAATSRVGRPLAETSTNSVASSSTSRVTKRKTPSNDVTISTLHDDAVESMLDGDTAASKRQRQSSGAAASSNGGDTTGKVVADDHMKMLGAIYRKLKDLSDTMVELERRTRAHESDLNDVKDLVGSVDTTVEYVRGEVEGTAGHDATDDISDKIDTVLESVTDRFETLDRSMQDLVRHLRTDHLIRFSNIHERLDEIDEKLAHPQHVHYHSGPNVTYRQ